MYTIRIFIYLSSLCFLYKIMRKSLKTGYSNLTKQVVALKEIRLQEEEGTPFTAIRQCTVYRRRRVHHLQLSGSVLYTGGGYTIYSYQVVYCIQEESTPFTAIRQCTVYRRRVQIRYNYTIYIQKEKGTNYLQQSILLLIKLKEFSNT